MNNIIQLLAWSERTDFNCKRADGNFGKILGVIGTLGIRQIEGFADAELDLLPCTGCSCFVPAPGFDQTTVYFGSYHKIDYQSRE